MSSEQDISLNQIEPQTAVDSSNSSVNDFIHNLSGRSGIEIDPEQIRIQLGRRVVHGTVGKEQRKDLTEDQIAFIEAAIGKPESTELSEVKDGTPSTIKISVGKETLFEQTGGVIKLNLFEIPESTIVNVEVSESEPINNLPDPAEGQAARHQEPSVILDGLTDLDHPDQEIINQTSPLVTVGTASMPLQEPLKLSLTQVLSEQSKSIIEGKQIDQNPEALLCQVVRELHGW